MNFKSLGKRAKLAIYVSAMSFVCLTGTVTQAAVLSANFSYDYTNDVLTDGNAGGLTWLSLNETRGRSYDDVSSKLSSGQEFDGYRYATGAEVNHLISNWIGTVLSYSENTHAEDRFDDLIQFIGDTYGHFLHEDGLWSYVSSDGLTYGNDTVYHIAFGIIADQQGTSQHFESVLMDFPDGESGYPQTDYSKIFPRLMSDDSTSDYRGSFLVQTTNLSVVPLPAALPLYGAGLAVMGFMGWRRKRKA